MGGEYGTVKKTYSPDDDWVPKVFNSEEDDEVHLIFETLQDRILIPITCNGHGELIATILGDTFQQIGEIVNG